MKHIQLFLLFIIPAITAVAQNPYKYESKVITVTTSKTVILDNPILTTTVNPGGFTFTGVGFNQRPVSYDITKTNSTANGATLHSVLQLIIDHMNGKGYTLKTMSSGPDITGIGTAALVFEKSSSYREAELYKLINELTTRIDTTSKKYTDSAMRVTHTNVLNYLRSIPDEVITQAYKDQLSKMILAEAEEKIRKVVEELKKEIRNSTTGNN